MLHQKLSRWKSSSFSLLWGGAARKGFVLLLCRRYPPDLKRDSQVSLHMVRWTKGGKEYGSEISQREADTDSLHLLFLFIDSLFVQKI